MVADLSFKAGDRSRTGDLQLGKLTLYQLSYARTFGFTRKPPSPLEERVHSREFLRRLCVFAQRASIYDCSSRSGDISEQDDSRT